MSLFKSSFFDQNHRLKLTKYLSNFMKLSPARNGTNISSFGLRIWQADWSYVVAENDGFFQSQERYVIDIAIFHVLRMKNYMIESDDLFVGTWKTSPSCSANPCDPVLILGATNY